MKNLENKLNDKAALEAAGINEKEVKAFKRALLISGVQSFKLLVVRHENGQVGFEQLSGNHFSFSRAYYANGSKRRTESSIWQNSARQEWNEDGSKADEYAIVTGKGINKSSIADFEAYAEENGFEDWTIENIGDFIGTGLLTEMEMDLDGNAISENEYLYINGKRL